MKSKKRRALGLLALFVILLYRWLFAQSPRGHDLTLFVFAPHWETVPINQEEWRAFATNLNRPVEVAIINRQQACWVVNPHCIDLTWDDPNSFHWVKLPWNRVKVRVETNDVLQVAKQLGVETSVVVIPTGMDVGTAKSILDHIKNSDEVGVVDALNGVLYLPKSSWTEIQLEERNLVHQRTNPTLLKTANENNAEQSHWLSIVDEWMQSIPEKINTLPRTRREHGENSRGLLQLDGLTLLVLVLTDTSQVDFITQVWTREHDAFFSESFQDVLVATPQRLRKYLAQQTWFRAPVVTVLPSKLADCESAAALELLALAFSLTMDRWYDHVVVLPFDRVPVRIWSEIFAATFDKQMSLIPFVGIQDNEFIHASRSSKSRIQWRFRNSRSSNRVLLRCETNRFWPATWRRWCEMAPAKSLSRQTLANLFVKNNRAALQAFHEIVVPSYHDVPVSVVLGTFLYDLLPGSAFQGLPLFPLGPAPFRIGREEEIASTFLFSGRLTATVVSPQVVKHILEWDLHPWRVKTFFQQDTEKIHTSQLCINRLLNSGIIGTHPGRAFNKGIQLQGEQQAREVMVLARESVRAADRQQPLTARPLVFIALVDTNEHLDMLLRLFVKMEANSQWGQHVVVVPDRRVFADATFLRKLIELSRASKVHVVPERYAFLGHWGGASLVFKELVGYFYALKLFPTLSHIVLMSGDSVPLFPAPVLKQLVCPGKSYLGFRNLTALSLIAKHDIQVDRHQQVKFECEGRLMYSDILTEIPPHLPPLISKHAQWKVLSGEHLKEFFLPSDSAVQQLFDSYWHRYKFGHIPDEIWLGVYMKDLVSQGRLPSHELVDQDTMLALWVVGSWHPDPLTLSALKQNAHQAFAGNYLMARKVPTLQQYDAILSFVFDQRRFAPTVPLCNVL